MERPESSTEQCVWHSARRARTRSDDPCSKETAAERIDRALDTLKAELVAMRQQDVQLLKQLIDISQKIRHLQRARFRKSQPPATSRALPAIQTSAHVDSPQPADAKPEDDLELLCPQRGLAAHIVTPHSLLTTSPSDSSHDPEEEVDSLYGSATDLELDSPSRCTSPTTSQSTPISPTTSQSTPRFPTTSQSTPRSPTTSQSTPRSPTTSQSTPRFPTTSQSTPRSPTTFRSLTFTQEELRDGDLSYGEILKRNVRLWKWSVGQERECVAWCRLSCAV